MNLNNDETKQSAIGALIACGFREIGFDGSGLPLLKSRSGSLLISVGSCRSLAYSPTAAGGRLQLVATTRTAALLCRVGEIEKSPSAYFPIHASDAAFAPAMWLTQPIERFDGKKQVKGRNAIAPVSGSATSKVITG